MWILADSLAIAAKKKLRIADLPDQTRGAADLRKPEGRMSQDIRQPEFKVEFKKN
ncbi:hypothetical protein QUA24_00520 [Microcoleus sp. Pol12B5]|uniref:hypothetical protein n=1 Tax=unclassified Microcoleus TaxID=2642155 RepID=UPI002FD3E7D6